MILYDGFKGKPSEIIHPTCLNCGQEMYQVEYSASPGNFRTLLRCTGCGFDYFLIATEFIVKVLETPTNKE